MENLQDLSHLRNLRAGGRAQRYFPCKQQTSVPRSHKKRLHCHSPASPAIPSVKWPLSSHTSASSPSSTSRPRPAADCVQPCSTTHCCWNAAPRSVTYTKTQARFGCVSPQGPEIGQVSPQTLPPWGSRAHSQHPLPNLPRLQDSQPLQPGKGRKTSFLSPLISYCALRLPQRQQHTSPTTTPAPHPLLRGPSCLPAPLNPPQEAPPFPAAGPAPMPRGSSGVGSAPSGFVSLRPLRRGGGSVGGERGWGAAVAGPGRGCPAMGYSPGWRWLRCWAEGRRLWGRTLPLSPAGRDVVEAGPGAEGCGDPGGKEGRLPVCLNFLSYALLGCERRPAWLPGSCLSSSSFVLCGCCLFCTRLPLPDLVAVWSLVVSPIL